jgi:hypothetical protein
MRISRDAYAARLAELAEFLSEYRTPASIARRFACSKFAAHSYLKALKRAGFKLSRKAVREAPKGPPATALKVSSVPVRAR